MENWDATFAKAVENWTHPVPETYAWDGNELVVEVEQETR